MRPNRKANDSFTAAGDSHIAVVPNKTHTAAKPLLLLDPNIAKAWECDAADILAYKDTALGSINSNNLSYYKLIWIDAICATPADIFLPELTFIQHSSPAIPGSFMPREIAPLYFKDKLPKEGLRHRITPLIPISARLLDYFSPQKLVSRLEFSPTEHSNEVKVLFNLPLTGRNDSGTPEAYQLTRTYTLKPQNALSAPPVLEIWPNFQASGWKRYYTLFHSPKRLSTSKSNQSKTSLSAPNLDASNSDLSNRNEPDNIKPDKKAKSSRLYITVPDSLQKSERFRDEQGEHYSLRKSETFPTVLECRNQIDQPLGIILPKPPPTVTLRDEWKVGVDMDEQLTHITYKVNETVESLDLNIPLLASITRSKLDTRIPTLLHYFLPDSVFPEARSHTLKNVLITRGSQDLTGRGERAILDGRICQPSLLDHDAIHPWLVEDLNWDNLLATRFFLKNLILLISAIAASQGVKTISWKIAYPTNLSRNPRNLHARTWHTLSEELAPITGLKYRSSDNPNADYFVPKSIALGQYFHDFTFRKRQTSLASAICLHIGEPQTDITIWQNQQLVQQYTIDFSASELLANFLEMNPGFVAYCFHQSPNEWVGLKGKYFHQKLSDLLQWQGPTWLKEKRSALGKVTAGQALIRLVALSLGGLYYYAGLIINVLKNNNMCRRDSLPPVYIGGIGAQYIHWLSPSGSFDNTNRIGMYLSHMLSRGAGFPNPGSNTFMSQHLQAETAYGLLSSDTDLSGTNTREPQLMVPGEAYRIHYLPYAWSHPAIPSEPITQFDIPTFDQTATFLLEFHKGLAALNVPEILPLEHYHHSVDNEMNPNLWQSTQHYLSDLIKQSAIAQNPENMRTSPPFILALRALLEHLGHQWAQQHRFP
ncbi:MAG: hypothetical protein AAFY72_02815 [Cyanobacteria bacterium J06649_4]